MHLPLVCFHWLPGDGGAADLRGLRPAEREAVSAGWAGALRNFEQLVALLPSGQPTGAGKSAAVVAAVKQHVPEVERIVLFVDDLDRCPHDKVVEVLQAVRLLLAFKLFVVVVVGVDSRWLERSLRAHYQNLLEEPADYLEKIFQIPFMLQQMTLDRYRDLIEGLFQEFRPAFLSGHG